MVNNHRLAPLLAPRSIAVVGASPTSTSVGNQLIVQLRRGGFDGDIYPINPKYDEIEGLACLPSLADLPGPIDHAVLGVGSPRIEAQLALAIEHGARAATILANCYMADDGDPPLLDRLRRRAREAGIQICGGNCMGFLNFESKVRVSGYAIGPDDGTPGAVAFISHSGTVFGSTLNCTERLGLNLAGSAGQGNATSAARHIDYALELPRTRVLMLFLETVRDPAGFVAALDKAASRNIPVVVLKVARTEASAAMAVTHSGAIAGSDAAFQAVCERHGAHRVQSMEELFATAALFAQPKRPGPGGLAAILDSGGTREHLVDLADDIGVPFAAINETTRGRLAARLEYGLEPVNPCDAWSTLDDFEATFAECFGALVDDPDTAIGLFFTDLRNGSWLHDVYSRAIQSAAAASPKPVAVVSNNTWVPHDQMAAKMVRNGIPVLDGTGAALGAVRHAFDRRDRQARPAAKPPAPPDPAVIMRWRDRLDDSAPLDEAEGLAMLADFGVPALANRIVESRDGALGAAQAFGYPVVAKTAMQGVLHKSDVGGVKLGLDDAEALGAAYDDLAARLGPRVLIAPMATGGVELALGVTHDPQFGPLVMVGAGGVLVELMDDARFALPPFDADEARRLIEGLRVRRLLDGVRGAPPADVDAVAETVARFSVLAATLGDRLAEVDVNPLIAGASGCMAVDALVVARPNPTEG